MGSPPATDKSPKAATQSANWPWSRTKPGIHKSQNKTKQNKTESETSFSFLVFSSVYESLWRHSDRAIGNRRKICLIDSLIGQMFALLLATVLSAGDVAPKPHVLFILVDDLGWADVGFNREVPDREVNYRQIPKQVL
jgi:hypothetical protein